MRLKNKKIVVTAAAQGIGKATALAFAKEGAQVVANVKNRPPMVMLGHVTSSYYSPNLNKSIALAVIKNGKKLKGKKLYVPMKDKTIEVTVSDPVFLDKEGSRLNA